MLVIGFLIILAAFLLLEAYSNRTKPPVTIDNSVLTDQTLAYHLDWEAIRDQKFLTYLYVKKVNAVVRYQSLAGVSYEDAQSAIEHILANPDLLPEIAVKRRPPIPDADDQDLRDLVADGKLKQATSLYAKLVEVDQFTAQQVIERMEREQYVMSIQDTDVSRLLDKDDETQAIDILKARYGLTQNEAIHAIDAILNTQLESN